MPTLSKKKKMQKNLTFNETERKEIYATTKWRKLRLSYLMDHPLCERCQKENRIVPAVDIHHIISFMTTSNKLDRMALAFNPDNLESLCKQCHQKEHSKRS